MKNVKERNLMSEEQKARFIELLKAAMGNRNAYCFSKEIKVASTTITRILNGQNTRSSSQELLLLIAEHAAPGSGVTIEDLREANGYSRDGSIIPLDEFQGRYLFQEYIEKSNVGFSCNFTEQKIGEGLFAFEPDYCIVTETDGKWYVDDETVFVCIEKYDDLSGVYEDRRRIHLMNSLLKAIACAQAKEDDSYSVLVDDEMFFKEAKSFLEKLKSKNYISVIYRKIVAKKIAEMEEITCLNEVGEVYQRRIV